MRINKRTYWKDYAKRQQRLEAAFVNAIMPIFRENILEFVDYVKQYGIAIAQMSDNVLSRDKTAELIKKYYRKCAHVEANHVLKQIKRKRKNASLLLGFDQLAPVVDKYFDLYLFENSVVPISETTKKHLVDFLIRRVNEGDSLEEGLKKMTRLALDGGLGASRARAQMIARTESTRALSFGGLIGAWMSNVDVDKIWVTCDDERVRDPSRYFNNPYSHVNLDGKRVGLMETYYNPGPIKFPGDPDADIQNTVNCRCCLLYAEKQPEVEVPYLRLPPRQDRTLANFITEMIQSFILGQGIANLIESLTNIWQDSSSN